jgi:hypothetical protein
LESVEKLESEMKHYLLKWNDSFNLEYKILRKLSSVLEGKKYLGTSVFPKYCSTTTCRRWRLVPPDLDKFESATSPGSGEIKPEEKTLLGTIFHQIF